MAEFTDSTPPSTQHTRTLPAREDCWSEEATSTLIDAWGTRYMELNRGNLRQKDWQEVADTVNGLHGHTKKTHRTDVQCKNRVDTIKKKYKTEKARVSSNGVLTSSWIFYDRLDSLIGSVPASGKKASPSSPPMALPLPYKKSPIPLAVALPQKRPASGNDDGYFRRNYSAMAAAAAAAEVEDEEDDHEEEEEYEKKSEDDERDEEGSGMRRLARAIEGFGEAYRRLEAEKMRQMVDLEKQRMQFAKDLEVQRMQMFMDTQVQLERLKNRKRSVGSNDIYS